MKKESTDEKQIPLHYAARFGSSDVIKCLINEYEANREAKDYLDRTPLYIAAEYGTYIVTKL
jgi:ankyrin repeat protein